MKIETIENSLTASRLALDDLIGARETANSILIAAQLMVRAFKDGRRVFSCGNGGSMCDAMHFAEELSGRYRDDRKGLPASAISDPGHISCVGNDYGYQYIFSRYLQSHAQSGDVVLGISTSGNSENVLNAARYARENGISFIALTGRFDSPLCQIAEVNICTPAGKYADRVQELHIKVIHILIELIERELFSENYSQ